MLEPVCLSSAESKIQNTDAKNNWLRELQENAVAPVAATPLEPVS